LSIASHNQEHPVQPSDGGQPVSLREGLLQLQHNEGGCQTAWDVFQAIRKETHQEHALLMGRVSWYITCQSFLLTIYAITSTHTGKWNAFSNQLLPGLAIVLSILAVLMIHGSTATIASWRHLRRQLLLAQPGLSGLLIRRWHHNASGKDWIHDSSLLFPQLIPMLFVAIWLLIARSDQPLWLRP
jgi:hypothetical protein